MDDIQKSMMQPVIIQTIEFFKHSTGNLENHLGVHIDTESELIRIIDGSGKTIERRPLKTPEGGQFTMKQMKDLLGSITKPPASRYILWESISMKSWKINLDTGDFEFYQPTIHGTK